jgi:LMBR1-like membrane protein
MLLCYDSLFKLKLFGSMALNGPHQSLPGQLMFNAQYLVRLQFPLGYNFLTLLRYNSATLKQVAFNNLMQNMAVSSSNCQFVTAKLVTANF